MDLFTAPVLPPKGGEYVYSPGAGSTNRSKTVGGRVNLNSQPAGFTNMSRLNPLAAVLQGVRTSFSNTATNSPAQAATLAGNICNRTLAAGGKSYGYPDGFDSPGEIVEIAGIADTGEASEELVRQVANLFTTRGNVFTVYSVGHALKQAPNGNLTVTGEQRLQAVIERVEKTDASGNKTLGFAPVYFRNLTP